MQYKSLFNFDRKKMYSFCWVCWFVFFSPLRIHSLFKDIHKMPQGRNDSARVSPMLRMYVKNKICLVYPS